MQRNWIGKSIGAHVDFKVKDTYIEIKGDHFF
jgi:leucyl-tRNA synthetase